MHKWLAALAMVIVTAIVFVDGAPVYAASEDASDGEAILKLSLEECIMVALENSHKRPASQFGVEIARAQHQQALSSFWPQVNFTSLLTHLDEDVVDVTPDLITTSRSWSTVIKGSIPGLKTTTDETTLVRQVTTKVKDKNQIDNTFTATLPLYVGGKRPALVRQAEQGIEIAVQESRRTDLEIIYDVKKIYYGAVLARELHRIGEDMLARIEATHDLTEELYKGGSDKVKKTDYLQSKIIVAAMRSMVVALKGNVDLAESALVFTMGLDWDTPIELTETEIPYDPYDVDLGDLIASAYLFSPDWAKLEAGLKALRAGKQAAFADHLPTVACFASLTLTDTEYDFGITNSQNSEMVTVGLSVNIPFFDGFLTANKVREAGARLKQLESQKVLLEGGIALQVKHAFLQMDGAREEQAAMKEALLSAEENRELNTRAYQYDLVDVRELIEAQATESFVRALYQKVLYDHAESQAHLSFVIGEEVNKILSEDM